MVSVVRLRGGLNRESITLCAAVKRAPSTWEVGHRGISVTLSLGWQSSRSTLRLATRGDMRGDYTLGTVCLSTCTAV